MIRQLFLSALIFLGLSAFGKESSLTQKLSKTFEVTVKGLEFRNSGSYPKDQEGQGHDVNAYDSWAAHCEDVQNQLYDRLGESIVFFDCGVPENVAEKGIRYQSSALVETKQEEIFVFGPQQLNGGLILQEDFAEESYPWQASREAARNGYSDSCAQLTSEMEIYFGENILFVDCGEMEEIAGKVGWNYLSTAYVFLKVDPSPWPVSLCPSGQSEGATWWEIDRDRPMTHQTQCPFGGEQGDYYERRVQKKCLSGKIETVSEEAGKFLGTFGECALPPSSCGSRTEGEYWWDRDADHVEVEPCPYGGTVYRYYSQKSEFTCEGGEIIPTGDIQIGEFLHQIGSCEQRIRHCGAYRHGSVWTERRTIDRDRIRCGQGGIAERRTVEVISYRCEDGYSREIHSRYRNIRSSCRGEHYYPKRPKKIKHPHHRKHKKVKKRAPHHRRHKHIGGGERRRGEKRIGSGERRRGERRIGGGEKRREERRVGSGERRRGEKRVGSGERRRGESRVGGGERRREERRVGSEERRRKERQVRSGERRRGERKVERGSERRRSEKKVKNRSERKVKNRAERGERRKEKRQVSESPRRQREGRKVERRQERRQERRVEKRERRQERSGGEVRKKPPREREGRRGSGGKKRRKPRN